MQLQPADIEREAVEVARKNLGASRVLRAIAVPWVDLDGDDTWRVTIVIEPDAVDAIDGAAVLDNLVALHERLRQYGDERLPFVEFATEEELRESDSPEP
jgi:Flp pilus assembly protein CpaB